MKRLNPHLYDHRHPRLRGDVLDLYNTSTRPLGIGTECALRHLAEEGYHDEHPEPNHWILVRAGVKVHLYGEPELEAFARRLLAPKTDGSSQTPTTAKLETTT